MNDTAKKRREHLSIIDKSSEIDLDAAKRSLLKSQASQGTTAQHRPSASNDMSSINFYNEDPASMSGSKASRQHYQKASHSGGTN